MALQIAGWKVKSKPFNKISVGDLVIIGGEFPNYDTVEVISKELNMEMVNGIDENGDQCSVGGYSTWKVLTL